MRPRVVLLSVLAATSSFAQPYAPLPRTLAGEFDWHSSNNRKIVSIPVELTEITTDGDRVKGIVAVYRTPSGNCVSDRTPFAGTYKDGALRIRSAPLKSQKAEDGGCGRVDIEAQFDGKNATGTLKWAAQSIAINLAPK